MYLKCYIVIVNLVSLTTVAVVLAGVNVMFKLPPATVASYIPSKLPLAEIPYSFMYATPLAWNTLNSDI